MEHISWEEWKKMEMVARKISRNMVIRENCYKVQHREYWTPMRLKKIFLNLSDQCWRFGEEGAVLKHILGM